MKTKKLLLALLLIIMVVRVQGQDLRATIDQSTFDKITGSMKIPLTLMEHNDPFKSTSPDGDTDIILRQDSEDLITYSQQESLELLQWAMQKNAPATDEEEVYKSALQKEWEQIQDQINTLVEEHDQVASNKDDNLEPDDLEYEEYSIEELRQLQQASVEEAFKIFNSKEKGALGVKAHLAYLKVAITERPALKVASPSFNLQNIRVQTTARGELWVKIPQFHCCRRVLGICVCVRVTWKWKRIASLTVSPKVGADATATFFTSNLKVYARGKLNKLFLDYRILRRFNLAAVVNLYLKSKTFELYDASAFVASLPYIDANFSIESVAIPANPNGVTVEVNIKD